MKKLIELIKKLLGLSGSSDKSSSSESEKGFTLIELIIVIAILGILAVAVLAAIDPVDKLRAGNDSKVQSDVRAIYDGAQRTAAAGSAAFPNAATTAQITELKSIPTAPTAAGYSAYTYFVTAAGDDAVVCGAMKSKGSLAKAGVAAGGTAYFTIVGGKACFINAACGAATVCP